MAHDVFISYAAADKAVADAVCTQLESMHHIRCWIAPRDIPPGVPWTKASFEALDRSTVMVSIFRGDQDAATPVDAQVQHALRQGISVVPLRLESTMPTGTPANDGGAPHGLDALTAALNLRISHIAESVRALLDKQPALTVVWTPPAPAGATAPGASMLGRGLPVAPAVPKVTGGRSSWLIPAVAGAALVLAMIVGLRLFTQAMTPAGRTVGSPTNVSRTVSSTPRLSDPAAAPEPAAPTPPPPMPPAGIASPAVAEPAARASASSTASPAAPDARPVDAGVTPAAPQPGRTLVVPEASAGDRAVEPPVGTATVGAAAPNTTTATPVDASAASGSAAGKPAGSSAGSALMTPGTLLIDFIHSLPGGSVEVEVDGRVRWIEQLALNKPAGVLAKLKIQRVSEQLGSKLEVPAGDHKITVTVLNAEGEVRDFNTTTLRVDAARSVTLRIRFSRLRNRLRLESAAG